MTARSARLAASFLLAAPLLVACAGSGDRMSAGDGYGFTGVDGEYYLVDGVCFRNTREGEPRRVAPGRCAGLSAM